MNILNFPFYTKLFRLASDCHLFFKPRENTRGVLLNLSTVIREARRGRQRRAPTRDDLTDEITWCRKGFFNMQLSSCVSHETIALIPFKRKYTVTIYFGEKQTTGLGQDRAHYYWFIRDYSLISTIHFRSPNSEVNWTKCRIKYKYNITGFNLE